MLDALRHCLDGVAFEDKKHHIWIRWDGRTYKSLRKGRHQERDPGIHVGTVKDIADHFALTTTPAKCLEGKMPAMQGRFRPLPDPDEKPKP